MKKWQIKNSETSEILFRVSLFPSFRNLESFENLESLISRNVDFRNFILKLIYYKNNFYPQKFSLDICQYTNLLVQITLRMVFIKDNSLKRDIFNPIFIPCFSGSRFFRVRIQGLDPGFRSSPSCDFRGDIKHKT